MTEQGRVHAIVRTCAMLDEYEAILMHILQPKSDVLTYLKICKVFERNDCPAKKQIGKFTEAFPT